MAYTADLTSGETVTASSTGYGIITRIINDDFDEDASDSWLSDGTDIAWVQIQFASATQINKLTITSINDTEYVRAPRGFTVEASNTGNFSGEEATLLTVAEAGDYCTQKETKSWTFDGNTTAYSYYRIEMTDKQEDFGKAYEYGISEIELMTLITITRRIFIVT